MADMTDQTPVTDDDRKAHEWADDVVRRPDFHEDWDQPIARAIKAHVPAPPKSLADEIREADWNGLGDKIMAERFADRVKAVEVENVSLRIERDQADYLMQKADRERDEARAEVERRKFSMRKLREDQEEAWGEVERLRGQLKDAEDERDAVGDLMREQDTRISNQRQELARLNAEVERVRAAREALGEA